MQDDSIAAKREELVVELYKTLRSEASVYIEKVPALWLQKFILIGAMLAFLLTQKQSLDFIGEGDPAELAYDLALTSVPILACLLDAKILEYGLHARRRDRSVPGQLATPPRHSYWRGPKGSRGRRTSPCLADPQGEVPTPARAESERPVMPRAVTWWRAVDLPLDSRERRHCATLVACRDGSAIRAGLGGVAASGPKRRRRRWPRSMRSWVRS
jgi:hypothetical protein